MQAALTPGIGSMAMAALVLVASALTVSRRSLAISAGLCFLALGFLAVGFVLWVRL